MSRHHLLRSLGLYNGRLASVHLCITSRSLISASYACPVEWNQRFQDPLIKKVDVGKCWANCNQIDKLIKFISHFVSNIDKFFFEINQRFTKKQVVNAIDIDLFVNSINRANQLDELEHLLVRFRRNWRTRDTLPSTHHTVVRLFLQFDQAERLLRLLENRLWIGIFPDEYCYNLMFDHFLETNRSDLAARLAILMTLQEDFKNPIANRLAFVSLSSCLAHPEQSSLASKAETTAADSEESGQAQLDEEEVEYRRVPYVRNPYFDDHFDLTDSKGLIGKSLWLLAPHLPQPAMTHSAELIGLALWGKWNKLVERLQLAVAANMSLPVAKDVVTQIQSIVDSIGDLDNQATIAECLKLLHQVAQPVEESLLELSKQTTTELARFEAKDQQEMKRLFAEWNQIRRQTVQEQLDALMKTQRLDEIKQKQQELLEEEEKLFFFDNLTEIEMKHEEAEKRIEEMRSKMQVDEEYIPPKFN